MQNAIASVAPISPMTPTAPVESKPSPRTPNPATSHAFATLLKQSQLAAPAPAKTTPVKPTAKEASHAADDETTTSLPTSVKAMPNGATESADARRADDAKAAADRAGDHVADADGSTARDDAVKAKDDKDVALATSDAAIAGTGVPLTHGLVAMHRLVAASAEGTTSDKGARIGRVATTESGGDGKTEGGAATTATSIGGALAPRGAPVDAGKNDRDAPVRAGTGPGDKAAIPDAETTPICFAPTASSASSATRTEATTAAAPAAQPDVAAPSASTPVDASIATPITSPDFAQAIAVQVSVFVKDGVHSAELHLNPVETGPVSVQIVVDGTQARIDFGADSLATRQAIEAGLPELAGALRDAGMTLQGGGVSQHARDPNGDANRDANGNAPWSATRAAVHGAGDDDAARTAPVVRHFTTAAGGVDVYA